MTLTKAHLCDAIRKKTGMTKSSSSMQLDPLLETMKTTIQSGEDIPISGFGKFCVKHNNHRRGNNAIANATLMIGSKNADFHIRHPTEEQIERGEITIYQGVSS